jgi:ArsR family transcriptional regulator
MTRETPFFDIEARILSVLANPKRLEIMQLLAGGERTVSDLAAALHLPQARTSQHLAALRESGLLVSRKEANFVFYRLASEKTAVACRVMREAIADLLVDQQRKLQPVLAVARDALAEPPSRRDARPDAG